MKKLIVLLSIFISSSLLAASINMACVTEYPTTSFVAYKDEGDIRIRLIHHNGVKYMPVWSSLMTPNDLPVVIETAKILSELGDELEFLMPASACEINGMMMNCFGRSNVLEINGQKVSLWSVYTKLDNEKSFAGEYNFIWSSMAIDIDGKSFWIPMKYLNHECFQDASSAGLKLKASSKNLFL